MPSLRTNWRGGVRFGIITFLLPALCGVPVCHYVLHFSWLTSILIASTLSSHTLISYPIISRFSLTDVKGNVLAVCSTIVAVLLALIVLAVTVDFSAGNVNLLSILSLLAWLVIYAVVVRYVLEWATRRFFRLFTDRVTQFIFVLAEVFAASLLAQFLGLEAILGAFYAGLCLNKFIPSRSPLMTRIEFVGNAIFIPYFLIGVGMMLNVGVIFHSWRVAWIALCITATALVCKWLAAWITARRERLDRAERLLMFGLTSGKAAATIAATIIGVRYGLIDEDVMNAAVIMILLCCLVASVSTQRAAMVLRMRLAEERMQHSEGEKRAVMARQLVAVANPMTAQGLMRMALYMRHPSNRYPITALFIRSSDDPTALAMGRTALHDVMKTASSVDIRVHEVERYDVNVVAGLTNVLKERNCTEIIIGLHRRSNIVDTFFGAMTENLLRLTNKMIILSRCYAPLSTLRRVVVFAPSKAEYETGFALWLTRVCMLATQIGGDIVFIAYTATASYIKGAITSMGFHLNVKFRTMDSWDDFITASSDIGDEDLLTVIGARQTSLSYSTDLEALPSYLSRYFSRHNILVIFPEQFGEHAELPQPIDALSTDIATASGSYGWLRNIWGVLHRGNK